MAFSFLQPDKIVETYKSAKQYTEGLTLPYFQEFERIARNQPHPSIDKRYPKTTDGTTASIIRKTPHRIIQQIPTGTVTSDTEDWLTEVASFIYTHKIIPYANSQYSLIQKCWSVVEKSLTFGSCATYTPFLDHDGYLCPDLTLPYWGDIFIQPGKLSDEDSNYIFMRSWWRTEDIDALIDAQSKLSKDTEKTWDVAALRHVKDQSTAKDEGGKTPVEREKTVNSKGGIELVTGFQRGVKAKFYTFHPNTQEIVRTKVNKDPRGELPVQFMYADIDGSNPLGRGVVELVGPLQNLMDAEMQMYQYNRALMLNPPLIKKGNFNKNQIKFEPNIIIDVGSEENADVRALTIDTSAIANFPNNYGLMKSQMLNLLASPDTSISADVGNPGFSKTHAGVIANQANLSVDDNYIRKQFEAWFERWSETAINIYFAERTGVEELQLDDETAESLRTMDGFDQTLLSDDNKVRINFDSATPALKFEVNASTSQMKNDQAQVEIASNLLDLTMKYPMLNSSWGGAIDVDELARKIVISSAIEDPETIAPEPTKEQKQAKEESKKKPNGFSPMFDKPSIRINYPDLPPAAQVQILGLAGVQVTAQDIMAGPVLDPNMRGTINPVNDPNMMIPGGQPGQPNGGGVNPIDIGDIYKQTTDPHIKAQIEKMAGLQPDLGHVVNQVQTNDAQAIQAQMPPPQPGDSANQSQTPQKTPKQPTSQPTQQPPQEQQPAPPEQPQPGITPEDQQVIQQLQQLGVPDDKIGQALAMLHHGVPEQDILKMIGVSGG